MNESLPEHDIVLLGAGHTNAHVIRMWRMNPIPGARLTCVSDHTIATYSGMLAGTLAGQYEPEEMEIDLVRLCASCQVRFIHARAVGLDLDERRVLLEDRPPLRFDLLSIGIGSRPSQPNGSSSGLSIKPMQTFQHRLSAKLGETQANADEGGLQIAIIGGGAAGVEVACCMQEFLRRNYPDKIPQSITLIESSANLLSEMPTRTRELGAQELRRRGIQCRLNTRISHVKNDGTLLLDDGQEFTADVVLWATSASPPALLGKVELPTDERGFLLTRHTLQSTGSDDVFVVGDTGTVEGERYAKAGVFAVRQAPVLWENLRRKIQGLPLQTWRPQSQFLSLIGTGDDRAILTYRGFSFHAKWCWWLKDWIDSRFMAQYQQYDPPKMNSMKQDSAWEEELAKQCGGCGSKASARVLRKSLPTHQQPHDEHVLMGLAQVDDIALITNQAGCATAVSTDFFTPFADDPFLFGRVAALNALSDLYAKGATPRAALSIAVLPPGSEERQAELLKELLAGALREFEPAGVAIVGGHSLVGPKLTFGFTVLGDAQAETVLRKPKLSPGDRLVLTKPLGTGVLLAAHMRAACRDEWWTPLVNSMLLSNHAAATVADQVEVAASTDVTGFGLVGHLLQMLSASPLTAEISLQLLPLLPGVSELLEAGFESTLAPSNRQFCEELRVSPALQEKSATKILFDPQTSGGLLLVVSEDKLKRLLAGFGKQAAVIGQLVEPSEIDERVRLLP